MKTKTYALLAFLVCVVLCIANISRIMSHASSLVTAIPQTVVFSVVLVLLFQIIKRH